MIETPKKNFKVITVDKDLYETLVMYAGKRQMETGKKTSISSVIWYIMMEGEKAIRTLNRMTKGEVTSPGSSKTGSTSQRVPAGASAPDGEVVGGVSLNKEATK